MATCSFDSPSNARRRTRSTWPGLPFDGLAADIGQHDGGPALVGGALLAPDHAAALHAGGMVGQLALLSLDPHRHRPGLRGPGAGFRAGRGALGATREAELPVLPYCPFIRGYI